jgi:hypothetical protein
MSKSAGRGLLVVPEFDYPIAWAADEKELVYLLRSLIEKRLVRRTDGGEDLSDSFAYECKVEPIGWEFVERNKNGISAMDNKVNIIPILRQSESHRDREIERILAQYRGQFSTSILDKVLTEFESELSQKAGDMVQAGLPVEEIARHLDTTVQRALEFHGKQFSRRGLGESSAFINSAQRWKSRLGENRDALVERCKISIQGPTRAESSDTAQGDPVRNSGSVGQETPLPREWDVFVCHASEDKEGFARPLAEKLRAQNLNVWFDEFTLTVGDSLRRSIDHGLAHSRFGVVIISQNFMRKEWPQKELDGLVGREVAGVKVILPVWHEITAESVRTYSPILADRLAASSDNGLDHVVAELLKAIRRGAVASTGVAPNEAAAPSSPHARFRSKFLAMIRDLNVAAGHAIPGRPMIHLLVGLDPAEKQASKQVEDDLVKEGVLERRNGDLFLTNKGQDVVYR